MELARQLLGVGCVLALLVALVWLQRKKGGLIGSLPGTGRNKTLELLERMRLTPHHSVHLLRVGERTFLLGVHNSGFTVLAEDRKPGPTPS